MKGPLPAKARRRTNAPTIPTTNLPAGGRKGRAPECPYKLGASGRKWWLWAWHTPQAAAWSSGNVWTVARRAVLEDVFAGDYPPSVLREMRELEDRLGLTPKAMAQLRWAIVDTSLADAAEEGERQATRDELAQRRNGRRDRIEGDC